jgi:hypothetical protein
MAAGIEKVTNACITRSRIWTLHADAGIILTVPTNQKSHLPWRKPSGAIKRYRPVPDSHICSVYKFFLPRPCSCSSQQQFENVIPSG